jgi:ADP-ribosylglycohydrolase
MGFEYASAEFVKRNNDLTHYVRHRRHAIRPGCYTDDTQMSIAIAELLVEGGRWRPRDIAAKFLDVFHRDRRTGYSGGFYRFLLSTTSPDKFLADIRSDSNKSGGAMRAPPLGVLQDADEVVQKATIQAQLTHNTREGIDAACASALLAHYCVHGVGPKEEAGKWIEARLGGQWGEPWELPVGSPGWQHVRAAITVVSRSSRLSEVLQRSVAVTGDVDTVAAIAMAAAAHCVGIKNDLSDFPFLEAGLENEDYGLDFLASLDARLMALKE